jgi:signal transduction histidine kinase
MSDKYEISGCARMQSLALAQTTDPALLVDRKLELYEWNRAAAEFFSSDVEVRLPKDLVLTLLSPSQHGALANLQDFYSGEITVHSRSVAIPQALVVIALPQSNPSEDRLLFLFKSSSLFLHGARGAHFIETLLHDLRNPIGAIFGYADVLLESNREPLTLQQQDIVKRIRSTAQRCIDLARNYQFLLQLDSPFYHSDSNACAELNSVIEEVALSLWHADSGMPKLELNLCKETLEVAVERFQLDRVIGNLLSNAIKFTPAEGLIKISSSATMSEAVFTITNNGQLIPASELPHLFDAFQRGSTAKGTPGSGLGLYIVKKIIDQCRGHIQIESHEKEGTTIRVSIPRTSASRLRR